MNEEELSEKLALWRGFTIKDYPEPKLEPNEKAWFDPNGVFFSGFKSFLNFPNDLNACFEWLVPTLFNKTNYYHIGFAEIKGTGSWNCYLNRSAPPPDYREEGRGKELTLIVNAETPALALCLAIEKLIDAEKEED